MNLLHCNLFDICDLIIVIKNMKTGKENIFDIPIGEGFKGGGNSHFSPDNKYLVYNIAHWNPDDEYYRTIVANSETEDQKVIIDDSQKIYRAMKWVSNNEILLRGPDKIDYILDFDGYNLRKIYLFSLFLFSFKFIEK